MPSRTAAIVGIGQTAYAKSLPATAWELAMEAVLAACADAGVDVAEVDGMCRFTAPFEPVTEAMLVRGLGLPELSFFAQAPSAASRRPTSWRPGRTTCRSPGRTGSCRPASCSPCGPAATRRCTG